MADIQIQISAQITDEWGAKASTVVYGRMADTAELFDLVLEAQAILSELDQASDGLISEARATLHIPFTGSKLVPVVGSRVEQTGLLGFSATGSNKRYSFAVPALSNASDVLVGDRIVLTPGNPMHDLAGYFFGATLPTAFYGTNAQGQDLTGLLDALVSFRKKRKQLQRSSFETA